MVRIDKLWVILLLLFISSCSVLKPPVEPDLKVKLNEDNLKLLNGTYNRVPSDTSSSNANDLFWLFSLKGYNSDKGEDFVSLNVEDERHIKVSLIKKDSVIRTKIFKGKIRNNSFEFNRRIRVLPVIVATIYQDSKISIGLLGNGNLIVDAKCMTYGLTLFILPIGGVEKEYNSQIERVFDL